MTHREELEATIEARRELGREHEDHLVAGFLDRLDRELDRRIDARISSRKLAERKKPIAGEGALPITIVSLIVAIPLMGIASGSVPMMVTVMAAIVLVNAIVWRH